MTFEERIKQPEAENVALENRVAYLEQQLYGKRLERHLPINTDALPLSLFAKPIDPQQQRLNAEIAKEEEKREKLIHIKERDRIARKCIDTSRLEVREEPVYPKVENPDEYREIGEPEVADNLVLIP